MKAVERAEVRVTREFNFPPERVFDAWLDPKTAGKWLFATPIGKMMRLGAGCELSLTHLGVFPEYAERTESGWAGILDGLAATLAESRSVPQ